MAANRTDNGHPDTIVPAPAPHKKRPAVPEVSHAKPKAPKKAKPTPAEQVAKMRQATINLAPAPAPSELVMMPLTLIETRAQVRTEFDDESLAELATDIAARGVLQPILLRPTPGACNYLVIAGERRLRAARLAGLENIPAIIGQIDDAAAEDMQLAENIQREDLNLADTAAAVRKIYDRCGSVTETAAKVRKSKSWVSKHLAASCPDLAWQACKLLDEGITEDLEIVLTVAKIAELSWEATKEITDKLRNGEAGRQTVREAYDTAKATADLKTAEHEARKSPEMIAQRKAEQEAANKEWQEQEAQRQAEADRDPRRFLYQVDYELDTNDTAKPKEIYDNWSILQRARVQEHLSNLYSSGQGSHGKPEVLLSMYGTDEYAKVELAAFIAGFTGAEYDEIEFLAQVKRAYELEAE